MTGAVLMALPPLDPGAWLRRRLGSIPFPLDQPGCHLYARARHGLWHGLAALEIGPGDEVLAPAYHHGSEITAIERAGARCVFYDALAPEPEELERLTGPRTRALHLVHHLGFPQDAARWRRWCDARGLALIEDAAQAWLAEASGRPAGAFGDVAIFSLYKGFGLPDGGALLCDHDVAVPTGRREAGALKLALEHAAWVAGRSAPVGRAATRLRPPRRYDPAADFALGAPRPASAATVLALRRILDPRAPERRRAHYERLLDRLGDRVPAPFDVLPAGASPLVLPLAVHDKAATLRRLRGAGIRALDLWSVPHPSLAPGRFPRAAALRRSLIGLPVHQELRRADLDRIAKVAAAA